MTRINCYTKLKKLKSFEERYQYLRQSAIVGESTFGFDRYLNQIFYKSKRWRKSRDLVIFRDNACDLGIEDYDIYSRILVHHMNPITIDDVEFDRDYIYDPEFLICTSLNTHTAIHFGDEKLLPEKIIERRPNDMCPWRI